MDVILERIWQRKIVFLSTFFIIFTLSYLFLVAIDFVPEAPAEAETTKELTSNSNNNMLPKNQVSDDESNENEEVLNVNAETESVQEENDEAEANNIIELPVSISIKKIDKTISVLNPASRKISDLDEALLHGVVRHPDSATLSQDGNVFILGHSSYLPNVLNRNFQAFNGIQNLEWGDTIEVFSTQYAHTYRVEKVYRAKAQDVTVPVLTDGKMLTLATCNSFGSVDDRFIVEAKLINSTAL